MTFANMLKYFSIKTGNKYIFVSVSGWHHVLVVPVNSQSLMTHHILQLWLVCKHSWYFWIMRTLFFHATLENLHKQKSLSSRFEFFCCSLYGINMGCNLEWELELRQIIMNLFFPQAIYFVLHAQYIVDVDYDLQDIDQMSFFTTYLNISDLYN